MNRRERLRYWARYEVKERCRRAGDRAVRALAWRLPNRLVMWAGFRIISNATTGRWSNQVVPDLGAMEAMKRWPSQ